MKLYRYQARICVLKSQFLIDALFKRLLTSYDASYLSSDIRKKVLQTFCGVNLSVCMPSSLIGSYVLTCICVQIAMVLVRMRGCAGSPEPLLLACAITAVFDNAALFFFSSEGRAIKHSLARSLHLHVYLSCLVAKQQKDLCAQRYSDQTGHPPSLIRVFAVRSVGS